MSKNLSQIIADLFAKPAEGKELSSQIQRLGVEIRNVVRSEDTVFGKFHGLLGSFREVIPDEQQRYLAALKALSTTSKLSRQEIIKAINGQLEEMKIIEKSVLPSLPAWRDSLKAMDAKAQERKGEIAKLRERLAQLESEEKTLLSGMAAREKDLEAAEKAIQDIFADIRAEMTSLNKKMEDLPAEGPEAQTGPGAAQTAPVKGSVPAEKKESVERKTEIQAAPAPVDPKFQKKCPMCGGQFNLLELQSIWQCFNCGHEEPMAGGTQGKSEKKSEPMNELFPAPAPEPAVDQPSSFAEPLASMLDDDAGTGKRPSSADPLASMPDDYAGTGKRPSSSAKKTTIKQKTCPGCRNNMFWYANEKAWRCPNCNYERRI